MTTYYRFDALTDKQQEWANHTFDYWHMDLYGYEIGIYGDPISRKKLDAIRRSGDTLIDKPLSTQEITQ